MSPILIAALVFACVAGGALLGLSLRSVLPDHHRTPESKEVVKGATALIGTISALVLGLLVASAKSSYDTQKNELTQLSARIILLDRVLAHYGPETDEARALLRKGTSAALAQLWSRDANGPIVKNEAIYDMIANLSPKDEGHRLVQNQAAELIIDLGQTRMLMASQAGSSISTPLLVIVVFWLAVNFVSFGLFANRNATVLAALLTCALCVAGAILLILEMDRPFQGLIRIPDTPLRDAVSRLGQ
jgi:hypothetical protein